MTHPSPTQYAFPGEPIAPFRRCTCGCAIETLSDWRRLPLAGFDCRDGSVLELRTHSCTSTLALVLVEHPEDILERLGLDEVA